jgi:hypothetical protein
MTWAENASEATRLSPLVRLFKNRNLQSRMEGGELRASNFAAKQKFSSARLQRVRPIERSRTFSAESASFPKFEHKRISRTGSESTRTPRGRQLCPENARTQDDRSEMPTTSPKCGLSLCHPMLAAGRASKFASNHRSATSMTAR